VVLVLLVRLVVTLVIFQRLFIAFSGGFLVLEQRLDLLTLGRFCQTI
jgi:hypothetical protein